MDRVVFTRLSSITKTKTRPYRNDFQVVAIYLSVISSELLNGGFFFSGKR